MCICLFITTGNIRYVCQYSYVINNDILVFSNYVSV